MTGTLRLMAVLAHPDDESLGTGGSLAKYGSEGVETYVVAATRGERGRYHDGTEDPGPETMGRIREQELLDAADVLGVEEVSFLDYMDGALDQVDPKEAIGKIVQHLRRVRPQVRYPATHRRCRHTRNSRTCRPNSTKGFGGLRRSIAYSAL